LGLYFVKNLNQIKKHKMKTSKLFLILPLIGMLSCGKAKQKINRRQSTAVSVTIKGSDTVLPLAQKRS
jgi:phosphate transport system substrate-binding protein